MKKRVLICEDDTGIAKLTSYVLKEKGYVVQVCSDGRKIIDLLQSFKPHVVLLDLRIPNINGEEILKIMRNTTSYQHISIVVFSADDHAEKLASSMGVGFLSKPFSIEDLENTVDTLIQ